MSNSSLIILGAGGHGRVVADIAIKLRKYDKILFADDNKNIKENMGFKVIGPIMEIDKYILNFDIAVAIGKNHVREKIFKNFEDKGVHMPSLIHPQAIIGSNVVINKGTIVMAGAVINSNVSVGKGCIINTNSVVEHDCIIGNFCHISPGVSIAGDVMIGDRTWVGMGSNIIEKTKVYKDCIIGAGTTVIKDIRKIGTYAGVPAKMIMKN